MPAALALCSSTWFCVILSDLAHLLHCAEACFTFQSVPFQRGLPFVWLEWSRRRAPSLESDCFIIRGFQILQDLKEIQILSGMLSVWSIGTFLCSLVVRLANVCIIARGKGSSFTVLNPGGDGKANGKKDTATDATIVVKRSWVSEIP